jgi:hypothetical protein
LKQGLKLFGPETRQFFIYQDTCWDESSKTQDHALPHNQEPTTTTTASTHPPPPPHLQSLWQTYLPLHSHFLSRF